MPDTSFIESAAAYCSKLTTRSKSNFYYAFLFLPRERREALEAVYAYCRLVDDVVDEEAPVAQEAGRHRQAGATSSTRSTATAAERTRCRAAARRGAALRHPPRGHGGGHRRLRDGHRQDALRRPGTSCASTATASPRRSGLMCIEIFGYTPSQSDAVRRYAVDLGIALQLTNILRDVAEDARARPRLSARRRAARLRRQRRAIWSRARRSPAFVRMMQFQAARARSHYLRARASISTVRALASWSSPRSWATSTTRSSSEIEAQRVRRLRREDDRARGATRCASRSATSPARSGTS